jgi:hypothetical protein
LFVQALFEPIGKLGFSRDPESTIRTTDEFAVLADDTSGAGVLVGLKHGPAQTALDIGILLNHVHAAASFF